MSIASSAPIRGSGPTTGDAVTTTGEATTSTTTTGESSTGTTTTSGESTSTGEGGERGESDSDDCASTLGLRLHRHGLLPGVTSSGVTDASLPDARR